MKKTTFVDITAVDRNVSERKGENSTFSTRLWSGWALSMWTLKGPRECKGGIAGIIVNGLYPGSNTSISLNRSQFFLWYFLSMPLIYRCGYEHAILPYTQLHNRFKIFCMPLWAYNEAIGKVQEHKIYFLSFQRLYSGKFVT